MNPTAILKVKEVFSVLKRNHPKALDYLGKTFSQGLEPGTELELLVTKPGQNTGRVKVTVSPSDAAAIQELIRALK